MSKYRIRNRDLVKQIVSFEGVVFENGLRPTDVDFFIEYQDRCFIFAEVKYRGNVLHFGQRLAFERLIDSLNKPSAFFIAEHETPRGDDIVIKNAIVSTYYWHGCWRKPKAPITLLDAVETFMRLCRQDQGSGPV